MLFVDGDQKKLFCPLSLKGPKPHACLKEKCMAFKPLPIQHVHNAGDDLRELIWGKPAWYCSVYKMPSPAQIGIMYPRYFYPNPPKSAVKGNESEDHGIEI